MYQSEGKACVNQLEDKRIDFGHVLIRPFAFIDFFVMLFEWYDTQPNDTAANVNFGKNSRVVSGT